MSPDIQLCVEILDAWIADAGKKIAEYSAQCRGLESARRFEVCSGEADANEPPAPTYAYAIKNIVPRIKRELLYKCGELSRGAGI
jgi:hypothetical protein